MFCCIFSQWLGVVGIFFEKGALGKVAAALQVDDLQRDVVLGEGVLDLGGLRRDDVVEAHRGERAARRGARVPLRG